MSKNSNCNSRDSVGDEQDAIMHELSRVFAEPAVDIGADADAAAGNDRLDRDYERVLTIPLPTDCGIHPGGQSITVSMRELLALLASAATSDSRQHILEVRNCCFSGDSEEDHYTIEIDHPQRSGDPEMVARVRYALEKSAPERERQRRDIEAQNDAEDAAETVSEAALWALVQSEKNALDAQWITLDKRRRVLDREWINAVASADAAGVTIDTYEATRARLHAKSAELRKAFEDYHEQWYELRDRARSLSDRLAA